MRHVKAYLENIPGSPYSQSAKHDTPFLDRESHDDYDKRTWREKCTTNKEGQVCVPAMAFKQCLDTAAFKLGEKVPGRRNSTYKNFFASGFFCDADMPLNNGKAVLQKEVESVQISANSDGVRGSGKRVPRRFPSIPKWNGVRLRAIYVRAHGPSDRCNCRKPGPAFCCAGMRNLSISASATR